MDVYIYTYIHIYSMCLYVVSLWLKIGARCAPAAGSRPPGRRHVQAVRPVAGRPPCMFMNATSISIISSMINNGCIDVIIFVHVWY